MTNGWNFYWYRVVAVKSKTLLNKAKIYATYQEQDRNPFGIPMSTITVYNHLTQYMSEF